MENAYYEFIYEVMRDTAGHEEKMTKLIRLKAMITNLHSTRLQHVMLDNDKPNRLAGERAVLFQILQM